MSEPHWLTEAQVERLRPFFPKSRGKVRVDDRKVLSGIIFFQRNGLMWKHAPAAYGAPKTLYNRWKRWSRMGVFATIMTELAARSQETEIVMIDATHAKAHRTASSLSVHFCLALSGAAAYANHSSMDSTGIRVTRGLAASGALR